MTASIDATRFSLLRTLFDLARDQRRALEAERLEEFEAMLDAREALLAQLLALTATEDAAAPLPANVIPFPGTATAEVDDALAIDTLIRGILEHDRHNEQLLATLMEQVGRELPALDAGWRGTVRYGSTVPEDARFIDRVS